MKAYPKHIDWGKVIATNEIIDGYVMPKYGNKNLFKDDSWIDIIMDDVYDTFYRDVEEEAKVAKASEDMKLSIMKEKFLAMVESEKARVKDYTKLVVTDEMVDYVLEKYRNKWKSEDEIAKWLTPSTLSMMLEKKLIIDYESEMAYQLLKFIMKQLKNLLVAVRITAAHVCVNAAQLELIL
ncbi:hypothetical protein Tco_1373143, partial [Tanacetum coccineum]